MTRVYIPLKLFYSNIIDSTDFNCGVKRNARWEIAMKTYRNSSVKYVKVKKKKNQTDFLLKKEYAQTYEIELLKLRLRGMRGGEKCYIPKITLKRLNC